MEATAEVANAILREESEEARKAEEDRKASRRRIVVEVRSVNTLTKEAEKRVFPDRRIDPSVAPVRTPRSEEAPWVDDDTLPASLDEQTVVTKLDEAMASNNPLLTD